MAYLVLGIGYRQNDYEAVRRKWQPHNVDFRFAGSMTDAVRMLREEVFVCVTILTDSIDSLRLSELHDIQVIPIVLLSRNSSISQRVEYLQRGISDFVLNGDQRRDTRLNGKDPARYYLELPDKGEKPITAITTEDIYFCMEYRALEVRGQRIELTPKEFDILALLITHPRQVFTFEMMLELVWGEEYSGASRHMVWNHMSHLRQKLCMAPDVSAYIKTIWGVGYKYAPPQP